MSGKELSKIVAKKKEMVKINSMFLRIWFKYTFQELRAVSGSEFKIWQAD